MLNSRTCKHPHTNPLASAGQGEQRGFSLIEILIAIVILAFGLLGLAGVQGKLQVAQFESYQRAQALLLLSEMSERMRANISQAANYASANVLGTGDTQPATCTGNPGYAIDLCQWSNDLKGAGEVSGAANVGGIIGARGCITQLQAPNTGAGICTPGVYEIDVVWQGMNPTAVSPIACGQGNYGANDALRRVVSTQITIPLPDCS